MPDIHCYSTAREMAAAVASKEISARELLELHLDRIAEVNPAVNALVSLDVDRAREGAAAADQATAHGDEPGPLHGLPHPPSPTAATGRPVAPAQDSLRSVRTTA